MPSINLTLEGDGCWPDLPEKMQQGQVIDLMGNNVPPIQVAALPGGMVSGKTSVTFRFDLPDGRILLAETSLTLLATTIRAIEARYEYAQASSPNAKPLDRLKAILSRIAEIAQEDFSSPISLGVIPAVAMAREELENWQRQMTQEGDLND